MGFYFVRSSALYLIDTHTNPICCENFRSCPRRLVKVFLIFFMLSIITLGSKSACSKNLHRVPKPKQGNIKCSSSKIYESTTEVQENQKRNSMETNKTQKNKGTKKRKMLGNVYPNLYLTISNSLIKNWLLNPLIISGKIVMYA